MRNLIVGGVGVIVLALASIAFGETVSLPLDAGGYYDVNTPAWTYDFDLGVTFSEITNVYIDWSGEITANLSQYFSGGPLIPCDGILEVTVGSPWPFIARGHLMAGEDAYPAPEPFNVRSTLTLNLYELNNLLDGKDIIKIHLSKEMTIPEYEIIDWGSATIYDATLVVEGTIIPEPATVMLLGLGLVQVIRRKHHKN